MRWITEKRFSYFDAWVLATGVILIAKGEYIGGVAFLVAGAVISALLEIHAEK